MPMPEPAHDPWAAVPEPATPPVPPRYRGVWQRTLLQTADSVDDSSWVRWLQLGRWHADLRVPRAARLGAIAAQRGGYSPVALAQLRLQQGFAGITQVETGVGGEICTWHRLVDYQPAGPHPDAGHMSFETPERVVEIGVHGVYREVWERLEGSTGRSVALAEPARRDGQPAARLFLAGRYLMRVRPCAYVWQPEFEISFGAIDAGRWRVEHSTRPELEGQVLALALERTGLDQAQVQLDGAAGAWRLLEWDEG